MGQMYDAVVKIGDDITKKDLPIFKTKGLIALQCGFPLGLITPTTPDDPAKLKKLRDAALTILHLTV